jgi:hypothetical protein
MQGPRRLTGQWRRAEPKRWGICSGRRAAAAERPGQHRPWGRGGAQSPSRRGRGRTGDSDGDDGGSRRPRRAETKTCGGNAPTTGARYQRSAGQAGWPGYCTMPLGPLGHPAESRGRGSEKCRLSERRAGCRADEDRGRIAALREEVDGLKRRAVWGRVKAVGSEKGQPAGPGGSSL